MLLCNTRDGSKEEGRLAVTDFVLVQSNLWHAEQPRPTTKSTVSVIAGKGTKQNTRLLDS